MIAMIVIIVIGMDADKSSLLFQGSEDLCVRCWDVNSPGKLPSMQINGFVYFPLCLDLDPGGIYLATGCKGFDSVGCEGKYFYDFLLSYCR
jgi:WD40 repeat protein